MKYILFIILIASRIVVMAQTSKETQYGAYLKASKAIWLKSIELAKKEAGNESFETAFAMYGLLNNTMASKDEDTFKEYSDQTIDLLKLIIKLNPDDGEPKAVLSSVYGLIMAYSPMKGMFYGPKSSALMDEALKDGPESPIVQKLYAGSKLYTPEMFGGSPEKARDAFERSIELFEQGETTENWLYLDSMVGLSLACIKLKENQKASVTLKKAIEIEPEYYWAKSILASLEN